MEELCVRLQTLAFHRALLLVHRKRRVIEIVTDELLTTRNETVSSARLRELLESTPDADVAPEVLESLPFKTNIPDAAADGFMVAEKDVMRAAGIVKGDVDPAVVLDPKVIQQQADEYRRQSAQWFAQQKEKDEFATNVDAPFPGKPDIRDKIVAV